MIVNKMPFGFWSFIEVTPGFRIALLSFELAIKVLFSGPVSLKG